MDDGPTALPTPPVGPEALAERVATEMSEAWSGGGRPRAEDYLARHPELVASPLAAARVIYEEICLREGMGQSPDPREIFDRFPQYDGPLRRLLACHSLLSPTAVGPPRGLAPGERLGDFTIRRRLGLGGQGQVYLATEDTLDGRPVVLKVTPIRGGEHLCLARLPHAHIVPLFAAREFPDRAIRVLVMPYLGGATLRQVFDRFEGRDVRRLTGSDLLAMLASATTPFDVRPSWTAARQVLEGATYPGAVAWLGACLAEALQFAHDRDILHLDLKPSNVLLARDGHPLLLDFHLARGHVDAGETGLSHLGGTPAYASPEQQRVMRDIRDGRPPREPIDTATDVYALGAVLYEALAGRLPESPAGATPAGLLAANPSIPARLAAIVCRCLAPSRRARPRRAGDLAADLRDHLAEPADVSKWPRSPNLARRLACWWRPQA